MWGGGCVVIVVIIIPAFLSGRIVALFGNSLADFSWHCSALLLGHGGALLARHGGTLLAGNTAATGGQHLFTDLPGHLHTLLLPFLEGTDGKRL
jgi:hypothetical protein